jgi:lipopolysaccharide/colanic/teichoic acid biosynthesis glycosyltransferase
VLKRAFDVVAAALGLLFLWPLLLILALIVRLESPGPVIFKQPRIGKGGKPFTMYKFRTMRPDAKGRQDIVVPQISDFSRYVFDPLEGGRQYTRTGRFLRSSSLDELPNLVNVLRGEMSIVGPRPEVPELVEQYLPEYHRRHNVRPGITGLAQISGRASLTYEQTMAYDLQYVDNCSFVRDMVILARTIPTVLSRRGAQ